MQTSRIIADKMEKRSAFDWLPITEQEQDFSFRKDTNACTCVANECAYVCVCVLESKVKLSNVLIVGQAWKRSKRIEIVNFVQMLHLEKWSLI